MTKKTKTISLQGKDYAQVKDRLKEFRQDCPNGSITTEPKIENGFIIFKAYIRKDKSDNNSADATGHAMGENKVAKAFEKLETIAVGRALALLGYAQDGDIASGEEMQEFIEYQENKKAEIIFEAQEKLNAVSSLDELKTVWSALPFETKKQLEEQKNQIKAKYENTKV